MSHIWAFVALGLASWYDQDGRMADGHWFSASRHLCATRHLVPFGTKLTLVNDATGAESWCIVEDYGPASYTGRTIDVSPPVRDDLGFGQHGVIHVRIYRQGRDVPSSNCKRRTCGVFVTCTLPAPYLVCSKDP